MAIIRIKQDQGDQYTIAAAGNTYILEEGVTIIESNAPGNGILLEPTATGNQVTILGTIRAFTNAISSNSVDTSITIGDTANLAGLIGVYMGEENASLSNAGAIWAVQQGVHLEGATGSIVNSGLIDSQSASAILAGEGTYNISSTGMLAGTQGIVSSNSNITITLGAHSIISAEAAAIAISSVASNTSSTTNAGLISTSASIAYSGGSGRDTLINSGRILGDVELNGGKDVFDGRGGYVGGTVHGGEGGDRYLISDSRIDILEAVDQGVDTVVSSVSYRLQAGQDIETLTLTGTANISAYANERGAKLQGNVGNNVLVGGATKDQLFGGRGNDRLVGGTDTDEFYFATGWGRDRIADFELANDDIFVTGWKAIKNLADVKSHATNTAEGVLISVGSDQLLLAGVVKAELNQVDFHFAA